VGRKPANVLVKLAFAVGMNRYGISFPRLSVVLAAIDRERCRRMFVLDKGQDVARCFIDRRASAMNAGSGNGDVITPCLAAVFAATSADVSIPPSCQNRRA
jgi:hypothetical protein